MLKLCYIILCYIVRCDEALFASGEHRVVLTVRNPVRTILHYHYIIIMILMIIILIMIIL